MLTANELIVGLWEAEYYYCKGALQDNPVAFVEFSSTEVMTTDKKGQAISGWSKFEIDPTTKPVRMARYQSDENMSGDLARVERFLVDVDRFTLRLCWKLEESDYPESISENKYSVLTLSRVNGPPVEIEVPVHYHTIEHPVFGKLEWHIDMWEGQFEYRSAKRVGLILLADNRDDLRSIENAERVIHWLNDHEQKVTKYLAEMTDIDWKGELSDADFIKRLQLSSISNYDYPEKIQLSYQDANTEDDVLGGHSLDLTIDENMRLEYVGIEG